MTKQFYVYILASKKWGTLYIGVTANLVKRIWQHKEGLCDGFTKKYNVNNLVYYETHDSAESAIKKEKRLKNWNRRWKINLIEENNHSWIDLYRYGKIGYIGRNDTWRCGFYTGN